MAMETAYLEKIKDNLDPVEDLSTLDYLDDMHAPDGKYVIWERQAGSIVVSKTVLEKYKPSGAGRHMRNLLKPEYKNLIAMPDPKSSGTGYFFYKGLVNQWGEEKAWNRFHRLARM